MTLAVKPPVAALQPISAFVDAWPPRDPWREREVTTVYLHPWQRFSVRTEQTPDYGASMWRNEEMAEAGICAASEDSKEFAVTLLGALTDQLRLRNLTDLREAISVVIHKQEVSRAMALRRSEDRSEG